MRLPTMRQVVWLLACGLAAITGCGDSVHEQFVTDQRGRALILHGVNVTGSAKDDPLRMPWITQQDAQRVASDWGFNLVRFLIFWDAAEPSPGQYDEAYLDRVAERVQWFADAGVYVILDMHQDVYGKYDSNGQPIGFDGAPPWATRSDGIPNTIEQPWSVNYIHPAVRRVFDNFWNDPGPDADLQEHYAAMWAHIAARFKGNPMVLGYNLMNEPDAGSAIYEDFGGGLVVGTLEKSIAFETTKFRSFYARMIAAIRNVDPDGWIFYEPLASPANNGGPSHLGVLSDPRPGESHLAYFPHLYPLAPEVRGSYQPEDTQVLDDWSRERTAEIRAQHGAMFIGEFGVIADAGGDPLGYLRQIMTLADRITSGWAYWSYDRGGGFAIIGSDGSENPPLNVLVRTYPQRVAGTPEQYFYDPASQFFSLSFTDRPGVSGPTEIYVPARRFYSDGWQLHVSDADGTWSSTWDADREVLSVTTPQTGRQHYILITPPVACGNLFGKACGWRN